MAAMFFRVNPTYGVLPYSIIKGVPVCICTCAYMCMSACVCTSACVYTCAYMCMCVCRVRVTGSGGMPPREYMSFQVI